MAITIQLTDGTTTYDLVYDAVSQATYKAHYGLSVASNEPSVTLHEPDDAPPEITSATNPLRTMFAQVTILGDDWDAVLDSITKLKRMIDGADSQAIRYQEYGDADKVYLKLQMNGATNPTYIDVLWGNVDDGSVLYNPVSQLNTTGFKIPVTLKIDALGYGDTISLNNELASSPHFLEDSNSDGIADGLTLYGGAAAAEALSTSIKLIGSSCQYFQAGASGAVGYSLDTVTASISTDAVFSLWVYAGVSGNDRLTILLADGAGTTIDFAYFLPATPAGYDKTAIDDGGRTWYRYSVSGTNSGAANFICRFYRANADATQTSNYYVDGAYLKTDTTTAPDAFMSANQIYNRYDPTAANEERINYVDIWGVPGDADAILTTEFDNSVYTVAMNTIMASDPDGYVLAADYLFWHESDTLAGNGTDTADASRTGGTYRRFTGLAATFTTTKDLSSADEFKSYSKTPCRVYAIVRASNATATIELIDIAGGTIRSSGAQSVSTTNAWEMIDLGVFNPSAWNANYTGYPVGNGVATSGSILSIEVVLTNAAHTLDIDAVYTFPSGHNFITYSAAATADGGDTLLDGESRRVLSLVSSKENQATGQLFDIKAGVMNRIYWAEYIGSDDEHLLASGKKVYFNIIPRARHLLGTA